MFCLFCRKHNVVKAKNQSKKFKMEPAVRFKKKAVEEHANSQQHSAAFTAELLSRVSTFNEETERKEKTRDEVYYNTFLAMYWLPKKEIANTKVGSLLELLEQVGLKDLKFFQHRSASSVREMFLLLGRGHAPNCIMRQHYNMLQFTRALMLFGPLNWRLKIR